MHPFHIARKYRDTDKCDAHKENYPQSGILSDSRRHKKQASENIYNIFRDNEEIRMRRLELKKEQEYDIVGHRELKSYNRIKERKKRELRSNPNDFDSQGTYISARISGALPSSPFLSKEQVLRLYSREENKSSSPEEYLLLQCGHNKSDFSFQKSWLSSIQTTKIPTPGLKKQQFSLSKLKAKMNEYKVAWRNYKQQQSSQSMILLKKRKRGSKHFNQKDIQRLKLCKPKGGHLTGQLSNWTESLRQNKGSQTTQLEIQRIQLNGMIAKGKGKKKKEAEWVELKHKEGYFFLKA